MGDLSDMIKEGQKIMEFNCRWRWRTA